MIKLDGKRLLGFDQTPPANSGEKVGEIRLDPGLQAKIGPKQLITSGQPNGTLAAKVGLKGGEVPPAPRLTT